MIPIFKKPALSVAMACLSGMAFCPFAFAEGADLGVLGVSFEDVNRYAPVASTGSAGLMLANRETPQMISTLNQARMKDQNLQTVKEVMENTAGMSVTSIDGGRVAFSSRGFDIAKFGVDGADITFNQQMSVGEYDLNTALYDKVEVTHGATGLVSGSGEPSARINLVRKKATATTPSTSVSANANRFGNYGISLDHARSITKDGKIRGRVVALHQDGGTFSDFEKRGQSALYGTVQADLGENTTVDAGLVLSQNRKHGTMWGGLPAYYTDGSHTDWAINKNSSTPWTRWDRDTQEYFVNLEHRLNDAWTLHAKAAHSQNKGSPKLFYHGYRAVDKLTGLNESTDPRWYYSIYRADNTNQQTHLQADATGEINLFGKNAKVMAGLHQNKHNLTAYQYPALDAPVPRSFLTWDGSYPQSAWGERPATPAADVSTTEKSLFGALQVKPLDKVSVVLGSRVSNYDKSGVQWGRVVSSKANNVWTPYAGVIYDVTPNSSIYASYTSIFKPQTARDVNGDFLKPEAGNTYEVGVKHSTDDNKLQGQLVLFSTHQDNYAQSLKDTFVKGTEATTKEQAYQAVNGTKSQGFALEVNGKLTPKLQVMAGYTQFNAKDKDGKELKTDVAKKMLKVFGIYDMSSMVNGLSVGGGVTVHGERYSMLENPATKQQERYVQKAVTLVNLMGRYQMNANTELQLNVSNALNQKYKHGFGFGHYIYGEPLNVSGSVTYKF